MNHYRDPVGRRRRFPAIAAAAVLGLAAFGLLAPAAASVAMPHPAAVVQPNVSTTQLQWDLAGMGYLPWSGIDGQPGPNTTAATEAFQSDACIGVDGIDGPQTDAALSAKVKQVQAVAGSAQDGAYGPNTKAAVQSWQSAHGLTADGQAGPATMAAMGISRRSCSPPPPPPPTGPLGQQIAAISGQELNNSSRNHEIGGYNCNYYSTALGVGSTGSCSNGWRTEEWCADFATWVWGQAGANTGGLNPGAISFYNYGVNHGTWHTGSPQVGDAAVFNVSGGYASHVGLVVSASGNSFTMISGNSYNPNDGADDAVTQVNLTAGSGGVSGFASPVS